MIKRLLFTAGPGYVGSGLLRKLLAKLYSVTFIDNLIFSGMFLFNIWHNKNVTFTKCDINDSEKLDMIFLKNNFDAVMHLAEIVDDPVCNLFSNLAIKKNLESSKWLIDRSKSACVPKFIFTWTCSNYGKVKNPYDNGLSSKQIVGVLKNIKIQNILKKSFYNIDFKL
jgi:UDP-glucose 4-epimerase